MDVLISKSFLPEIFLSFSLLLQLIFNIKLIKNIKFNLPAIGNETYFQTIFILLCLFFLYLELNIEGFLCNFLFVNDNSTRILKIAIVSLCIIMTSVLQESFKFHAIGIFEFYIIYLLAILSVLLIVSAHDLISFYILVEMQSICFYILAAINRYSIFSLEAGLKYFLFGSFFSGIFLLGASIIYGTVGTLNLAYLDILLAYPINENFFGIFDVIKVGVSLIFSMLLFKIACAPFHFWSPDVYEGSPICSTIIFSLLPKLSIFYFFSKFCSHLNIIFYEIQNTLLFFGFISVIIGTFFSLSQTKIKRLLIFSSVTQVGFLVIALSLNTLESYSSLFFFLLTYIITSLLAWGHVTLFYSFKKKIDYYYNKKTNTLLLSGIANFFELNPYWSFSLALVFFSMAGVPPLMGFISKYFVLSSLVSFDNINSSIFLILISCLSAFYYVRLIKIIFFEPKVDEFVRSSAQTIFFDKSSLFIFYIFSILMSIIISTILYPNTLYMVCELIILNSCIY